MQRDLHSQLLRRAHARTLSLHRDEEERGGVCVCMCWGEGRATTGEAEEERCRRVTEIPQKNRQRPLLFTYLHLYGKWRRFCLIVRHQILCQNSR